MHVRPAALRALFERLPAAGLLRCDFVSRARPPKGARPLAAEKFDALLGELALYAELLDLRAKTLGGFDVGGGTPSFVDADHVARLLDGVAMLRAASAAPASSP